MTFDHNKYFKNALKTIIYPELKKNGFTKRGTLTFVRRTKSNIIQVINFQRSRWDSKNFYVNAGNLTMHTLQNKFYPEIGDRLSYYEYSKTDFNFQIPMIGDISLKDVLNSLKEKVLPYLDYCHSLERIHSLSIFLKENEEQQPFLKYLAYKENNVASNALMYLRLKDYKTARKIYSEITEVRLDVETNKYRPFKTDKYDEIIDEIDKGKFDEIENRIERTIQQSLSNLKFDKLKIRKSSTISLDELISQLKKSSQLPTRRSTFPYYHYKIFTINNLDEEFTILKNHLSQRYESEIREHEIIFHVDEKFSFYLAINEADYVEEESIEIVSNYTGEKDISWIKSCKRRIEFWSDNDKNMDFFNEHLYVLQDWEKLNIEILHGYKLVFFDEE